MLSVVPIVAADSVRSLKVAAIEKILLAWFLRSPVCLLTHNGFFSDNRILLISLSHDKNFLIIFIS